MPKILHNVDKIVGAGAYRYGTTVISTGTGGSPLLPEGQRGVNNHLLSDLYCTDLYSEYSSDLVSSDSIHKPFKET